MDWLSVGLGLLSVVGIPLAFVWGRRNRQKPDLRVSTDFDQVMAPLSFAGGLRLEWKSRSLKQVSRTNIALWNHRGDTVRADDIVDSDPLRIAVGDEDEILQVRVASFSREQIDLSVDGSDVAFDFLDASDGGVLEVLHLGDEPARVVGTIRGATFKDAGPSDLSRSGRANRQLPMRKRFFASGRGRITRILWSIYAIVGLLMLGLGAAVVIGIVSRLPMLVDPGAYDLSTVAGQAEFADRVGDVGSPTQQFLNVIAPMAIVAVFYAALIIWGCVRVVRSLRSTVPTSIFGLDTDGPSDPDSELELTASAGQGDVVNVKGVVLLRKTNGRIVKVLRDTDEKKHDR